MFKKINAFIETWEKLKIFATKKRVTIPEILREIVDFYEKNKNG
jgi:hypothetical protein